MHSSVAYVHYNVLSSHDFSGVNKCIRNMNVDTFEMFWNLCIDYFQSYPLYSKCKIKVYMQNQNLFSFKRNNLNRNNLKIAEQLCALVYMIS